MFFKVNKKIKTTEDKSLKVQTMCQKNVAFSSQDMNFITSKVINKLHIFVQSLINIDLKIIIIIIRLQVGIIFLKSS